MRRLFWCIVVGCFIGLSASGAFAQENLIYACAHKQNGKLRIVSGPGQCLNTEYSLWWSSGEITQQTLNELLGRVEAIESALGVINEAPTVNAGEDQTILVSMTLDLQGSAIDDGLVAELTYYWEHVSGPAVTEFVDPYSLATSAYFSETGLYTLRLTVYDGFVHVADEINIRVYPDNSPPTIVAAEQQIVGAWRDYRNGYWEMGCEGFTLDAEVFDDGLPLALSYEWKVDRQPQSSSSYVASAVFLTSPSDSIDWLLRINAKTRSIGMPASVLPTTMAVEIGLSTSDGYWHEEAGMEVVCSLAENDPPEVDAGADVTIEGVFIGGSPVNGYQCDGMLAGTATDDGLPSRLSKEWVVHHYNPAPTSQFEPRLQLIDPYSVSTDFRFSIRPRIPGYYQYLPNRVEAYMRLTAHDGYYTSEDTSKIVCLKPGS